MKKNIVVASCFCLVDIFSCGLTQNSSLFGMINAGDVSEKKETPPIKLASLPPGLWPENQLSPIVSAPFPFGLLPVASSSTSSSSSSAYSSSYERLILIMENFKAAPSLDDKRQYISDHVPSITSAICETYSRDTHGEAVSVSKGCLGDLSLKDLWDFYTVAISVHSSTQPSPSAPVSEGSFCNSKQLLQNVILERALHDLKTQSVPTGLIKDQNVFELFPRIIGDFCRELVPHIAHMGVQKDGTDNYHGKDINSKCRFRMISYFAALVKCLYGNSFYISKNDSDDYDDVNELMDLEDQLDSINLHEIFGPMMGLFQSNAFINSTTSSKARMHYLAFALCMYKKLNNLRDLFSDKYDDFLMFHLCQCIGCLNDSVTIAGGEKNLTLPAESRNSARERVELDRRACMDTIRQLISTCIQHGLCSPGLISSFRSILLDISDRGDAALTRQMFNSFPETARRRNLLLGNRYTFYKTLDHFSWFPEIPYPKSAFVSSTWFGSASSSSSSSNGSQQSTQVTLPFPRPPMPKIPAPKSAFVSNTRFGSASSSPSSSNGGQQSTQVTLHPPVMSSYIPRPASTAQSANHPNGGQQSTQFTLPFPHPPVPQMLPIGLPSSNQQSTLVTQFTPFSAHPPVTSSYIPRPASTVQSASHPNGGQQSTQFTPFSAHPPVTSSYVPQPASTVQNASHPNGGQQSTQITHFSVQFPYPPMPQVPPMSLLNSNQQSIRILPLPPAPPPPGK